MYTPHDPAYAFTRTFVVVVVVVCFVCCFGIYVALICCFFFLGLSVNGECPSFDMGVGSGDVWMQL